MQIPVYSAVQPVPDPTFRVSTPLQPTTRYTQSPRPPSQTPVPAQQAQPQPQPQPPHVSVTQTAKPPPVAVPNYPPQQVGQQFIPQQQATRNGVQKQGSAAALATMAAHMLQGQGLSYQQQMQMYAQHRNLQQQQQQRLQSQKMNGRATPQAGVASPAQQPHAALSPANQASSPLVANQQLAVAAARSPMPPSAPQPTPAQASVAQQPQQAQPQLQPSSMPRSPAQQPAQAHGQHPGYGQFNLRGMMPANPSAAHQALQAAITNVANTGAVRAGMPPNSAGADHLQQPQHPAHPQVQPPGQPTQPQPNQQPPQTQAQAQSTPHPQQAQQALPRQMYPQMYSYHQLPFNMQNAGRMPQAYWGGMGMGVSVQGMPGVPNMAGIAGMQSIQGVPGMQGLGGMPPGMMPGMGRGIPMGAQQMAGMAAAAGAGAGHVPGGQGKAAVQGSMQR